MHMNLIVKYKSDGPVDWYKAKLTKKKITQTHENNY